MSVLKQIISNDNDREITNDSLQRYNFSISFLDAHPDQEVNKTCRYERLWTTNGVMEDKEKGGLVDINYNMKSYSECESKCSLTKGCMNFEFCKKLRSCRLYDGKITSPKNLKKKPWYDCYASYRTCQNGNIKFIYTFFYCILRFNIQPALP